jgi:hypothetical protein
MIITISTPTLAIPIDVRLNTSDSIPESTTKVTALSLQNETVGVSLYTEPNDYGSVDLCVLTLCQKIIYNDSDADGFEHILFSTPAPSDASYDSLAISNYDEFLSCTTGDGSLVHEPNNWLNVSESSPTELRDLLRELGCIR